MCPNAPREPTINVHTNTAKRAKTLIEANVYHNQDNPLPRIQILCTPIWAKEPPIARGPEAQISDTDGELISKSHRFPPGSHWIRESVDSRTGSDADMTRMCRMIGQRWRSVGRPGRRQPLEPRGLAIELPVGTKAHREWQSLQHCQYCHLQ